MVRFLTIGIGLNVNNPVQGNDFKAVSLGEVLQGLVSRKKILSAFLREFASRIDPLDGPDIMAQWKKQTSTIGTHVRVETVDQVYEGNAVDVDETGALIIVTNQNQQKKIIYGDCFHL
jgi:BirA family biotin operon repressor/biotin-[acetyl-CoA-carboxylase] ligase